MAFKKEKTEEQSHYYAGQKKGLWWKYLLAVFIILIYLLPLYVLLMQSLKAPRTFPAPCLFLTYGILKIIFPQSKAALFSGLSKTPQSSPYVRWC